MTVSIRNGLLALAFGLLLVLAAGYGALAFLLVTREGWSAQVGDGTLLKLLIETITAPLGSLVGFVLLRRAYRKSAAPEVFFLALFLATLAGESLILLQAWVNLSGLPAFYTALLTRVVWAFRLTGLFLLVCGSLYAFEFSFRKYGNLVAASVAAGIFLAVILPLHFTSARNHLLFAVGDAPGMVLATVVLAAVVAANFLVGSRRPGAPDRAWARAWAAVLFLSAWSLSIVAGPWATVLALPGIVLVSLKSEQNALLG
jgi:hypothetical protein